MTKEQINNLATKHCDEVLCSVCTNKTCICTLIKCREWRDRRAGFYCGYEDCLIKTTKLLVRSLTEMMHHDCEFTETFRDIETFVHKD